MWPNTGSFGSWTWAIVCEPLLLGHHSSRVHPESVNCNRAKLFSSGLPDLGLYGVELFWLPGSFSLVYRVRLLLQCMGTKSL